MQTFQFGSLVRIAEETVEHLLDLHQIALNLLRHLPDQQLFLRLARHFIEQGDLGTRLRSVSCDTTMNARNRHVHLVREIAAKLPEIHLRVLGQQDGGGNLHRQDVRMAANLFGEPICGGGDGLGQATEIGMPQLRHESGQVVRVLLEQRQRLRGSGTKLVPRFFCAGDDFAQLPPNSLFRSRRIHIRAWNSRLQLVSVLDLLNRIAARIRSRDKIERIAHQALGNVLRPVEQTADLQINPCAELFGMALFPHSTFRQSREKSGSHPPERTGCSRLLRFLDPPDGELHIAEAASVGRTLQPGQEPALKTATLLPQELVKLIRGNFLGRCITPGRPRRQIREEKIGCRNTLLPTSCLNLAIDCQQTQRLVGLAIDQVVKIVANSA